MKKQLILLTIGLYLISFSTSAVAGLYDLDAPDWRGQKGTTWQQWDFVKCVAPDQPIQPDAFDNPNGPAELTYYPGRSSGWKECYGDMKGVLPLSGKIKIDIPNFPDPNPYKDIIVQVIWASERFWGKPCVVELLSNQKATLLNTGILDDAVDDDICDVWRYSTYKIRIKPNPARERICIAGSVMVDSVIIDTICVPEISVPEPATMILLGLGGLILQRRRKV